MSEERETSSNISSSINNNDDNNNNNNNNNNGTCVVCYKNVEIYSIGMCEHPVCYECSTRMRVLCRQNECPICRQDLPKVVFIKKIKPFRDIIKGNLLDTRYNIFFDNTYIQEKFTRLLSHICPICKGNKKLFGAFTGLKDHMRREHDLHYCDLCVDNLKIFTNERRCYTRFDLGVHRRKGDKDDKSHRGHPLCEFCECRYMDNDELFRHLRRDHLYCHFCDADGLHQYYDSYDYLRDHFSKEHYLCEEGPCADEKFTSVFRSDIDLKAHKSSVHSKFMGKAAAKQARTLELEFTLAPRGDNNRNNRRGHQQSNNNNNNQTLSSPSSSSSYNSRNNNTRDYYDTTDGDSSYLHESEMPSASSMKQPNVQSTQEFPSLGNAAAASSTSTGPVNFSQTKSKGGRGGNLTIRGSFGSQKLSINNENFPALGSSDNGSNSGLSNIVNLNVYSSSSSSNNNNNNNNNTKNNNNNNNNKTSSSVIQTSSSPNVSIQVNHKTNGNNITTRLSRPTLKPVAQLSKKTDDFPALGGNCTSAKNSTHSTTQNTGQWTKVTCVKPSVVQQSKKIIQTPPKFNDSISEAFPSLPKTAKDKKKSSTLSVTTTSNNNTITKIQKNDAPPSPSSSSSSSSVTAAAAAAAVVKNTKNDDTNDNSKKKKKKKTKTTTTTTTTTSNNSSSNESVVSKIIEKKNDDKKKPTDNNTTDLQDNNNSTKNITRKRSELKIDNLKNNISKKNNDVIDDFPALGSPRTSTPLKPPPGFSTTRPPPPPGFAVKINSIVRPQKYENNLTFTNSSGQNFPILPDKNNKKYTYSPPPDFQQRNKNLVAKISSILELKDAIEEFRYLSGLFRQDMCTAEDYYKRCRMEMGLSEFLIIFPEILVLLPDINKQRELYNLHKHETNGQIKGLELCTICGQVCKSESDIVSHLSGHTLEHDFPALGLATGTQTSNNNWPRKNT